MIYHTMSMTAVYMFVRKEKMLGYEKYKEIKRLHFWSIGDGQ